MTGPAVDEQEKSAPELVVKGEATATEVAAVTAALRAAVSAAAPPVKPPRSTWASPRGRVRPVLHAGPNAWRTSLLPR